jgi:DamX protein
MPALARADINTATSQWTTEEQQDTKAVIAEISVTARIERVLRYTKQAVLVVAEQVEQYSTTAQTFLVNLSNETSNANTNQCNVAFVSASVKLNDIQIRCRLIEQLFSDTLFDPEQSLVVSVLRLAKQQGEAITIVIEHAHALSLQIKYELSQLVVVAKQNKQVINVVMFAQTKAVNEISKNKSIFKNKLTIVDAVSGQLYSGKNEKFSGENETKWLSFWQKVILISSLFLMIVASISLFFYLQTEQGSKYLHQPLVKNKESSMENQAKPLDKSLKKASVVKITPQEKLFISVDQTLTQRANVAEINQALINAIPLAKRKNRENISAKTNDVLSALLVKEARYIDARELEASGLAVSQPQLKNGLNVDYYFTMSDKPQGVVIQIAGFSDHDHWKDFLALYPKQIFYSYQKVLSEGVLNIITSKVYPNRMAAKAAMQDLPKTITERQLWLKPISTVIAEINTFTE